MCDSLNILMNTWLLRGGKNKYNSNYEEYFNMV